MWSADSNDNDAWLDAFVTDFLTRARERNFALSSQAFEQALDRLRNEVVNAPEPTKDNAAAIAYALYVLARNGRPVIGDLRYLTDAKLDAFTTPLAKAQLAAALAMLGDQARAAAAFGAALKGLEAERDGGSRPDYGSRLRDAAAVLALVAEAKLGNIESDAIARAGAVLEQARAERSFLSTQEMNWMTLAAEGLAEHDSLAQFRVDGEPVKGALYRRWSAPTLSGQSIVIANAGQNPAQLVVSVSGAPIEPDPAVAKGYAIERSFYKLDGTKLDALQSMVQNERVVVSLKVTEAQARYARLLVVDRLPPVSRSTIPRSSTAARSKPSRGSARTPSPCTPNIAMTVSSRHSIAPRASRRSSPWPISCAPSRPVATSIRQRRPKTCTTPTATAAPPLAIWR